MKVAIVVPPWLALPVRGYGGIELVIESLVTGLKKHGVELEIFGNGDHKIRGVKTHYIYKSEQFSQIHKPYYEVLPILNAHLEFALNKIRDDGSFDIIHDHNTLIGPMFFSLATQLKGVPPALHTFHGPPFSTKEMLEQGIPDNRPQLDQLHDMGDMYTVAISEAMARMAPKQIQAHMLPAVHNAIDVSDFPFVEKKDKYYITLARFHPDKGQHIAVKYAVKYNKHLRMAGTVAGMGSGRRLLLELSNPLSPYRSNQEFQYYSDKILPYSIGRRNISYVGNLSGARKMNFISQAKALLFPIDWEEPFGMAVIEALACGTPVVAMRRGSMPEIIQHGVNGFLADNEKEFAEYMLRVDEIDPAACRKSVEMQFSAEEMAKNYIDRYEEVLRLTKATRSKK
jgi:glycosyltransferase involved in cell wall biosynthesis